MMDDASGSNPEKSTKKIPFSSSERELIIELVRERPIIEDKRTNGRNIEAKRLAWDNLTIAYNSQPYVLKRTNLQLKRCWENIKSQRKRELAVEARSIAQTGGGPGLALIADNAVDAICPAINFTVPGVIDSNSIERLQDSPSDWEPQNIYLEEEGSTEEAENVLNEETYVPPPQQKRKLDNVRGTPTRYRALESEMELRKKRCRINILHDQRIFNMRVEREEIMIERERNMKKHEEEMNMLEKEKKILENKKLKLEIEILERKIIK